MSSNIDRQAEIARYAVAYAQDVRHYGMGRGRRRDVPRLLAGLAPAGFRGSYLDVGTGRGEALRYAREIGFASIAGTEVVPDLIAGDVVYAEAHALPFGDGEFDHVTCFDVLEHLVADDVEPALLELNRVARLTATASASCRPSPWPGLGDLHISARPFVAWQRLIQRCWGPSARHIGRAGGSPCFQVRK